MEREDNDFDICILGTGFTETLLACAFALKGKKVLHLDKNDYYGGNGASFTFRSFVEFLEVAKRNSGNNANTATNVSEDKIFESKGENFRFFDGDYKFYPYGEGDFDEKREKMREEFFTASPHFNFDITPKVLESSCELVELLVRSGVSRYLEFDAIKFSYLIDKDANVHVSPRTKGQVLSSSYFSSLEKRNLMLFIKKYGLESKSFFSSKSLDSGTSYMRQMETANENANETSNDIETEKETWEQFMESQNLTKKTQNFISLSLCRSSQRRENIQTWSKFDGLELLRLFAQSFGRYSALSDALLPQYGFADIPQGFCRMASIFGAVYMLRTSVASAIALTTDGEERKEGMEREEREERKEGIEREEREDRKEEGEKEDVEGTKEVGKRKERKMEIELSDGKKVRSDFLYANEDYFLMGDLRDAYMQKLFENLTTVSAKFDVSAPSLKNFLHQKLLSPSPPPLAFAHFVLVTDRPLLPLKHNDDKGNVSTGIYVGEIGDEKGEKANTANKKKNPIHIIQSNDENRCCPSGKILIHMYQAIETDVSAEGNCESSKFDDLKQFVHQILNSSQSPWEKSSILFQAQYLRQNYATLRTARNETANKANNCIGIIPEIYGAQYHTTHEELNWAKLLLVAHECLHEGKPSGVFIEEPDYVKKMREEEQESQTLISQVSLLSL